ncbi:BREX system serine/threonine kinase PglW [Naumannella sp. ID2617S]|nr:BREX system serine/threonine kinase PglW [Naumannella sp. ID2617S]
MLDDERWTEVTESSHQHEQAGLQLIREMLPNVSPYRVWTNCEFKDSQGRWREVDALVLGRGALHLVELKYYNGPLRGNDLRWFRAGHRVEDSPLLLARRKAQRFASKLKEAARQLALERNVNTGLAISAVPYVQESVFIHHPGIRSTLDKSAAQGIFGLDGHEVQTGLAPISARLLELPREGREIRRAQEDILQVLMNRIGLVPRREAHVGSWNLVEAIAEGDNWQDWRASHQFVPEQAARIRFHPMAEGDPASQAEERRRLAGNEYRVMSALQHDGLIRPNELVTDSELGPGLVYPYDESAQRLDLWLAGKGEILGLEGRLRVIRQAAEALHYAHRNKVVHRGLNPQALWVLEEPDGLKVRVAEWQSAGLAAASATAASGITSLQVAGDDPAQPYRAPEGVWSPTANRIRLDVFGLGATAYFVLTGQPPATTAADLRERLRDQGGLDISADLPQASSALRQLVLAATRPRAADRTGDVGTFLDALNEVERSLTQTATEHVIDPLEARPGDLLDDRFELVRRLGAGSTAVGLLVIDHATSRQVRRVLKVARDERAEPRLDDEAEVLGLIKRPAQRIVQMAEPPLTLGGRRSLVLSVAGEQTLAEKLTERTRLSLDLLERWGDDLLEALEILDASGVDHRDIKPANLGVHEFRSDGMQHLVLFDFSLSRAASTSLNAGTVPYLDPFLGGTRSRFDAAAERYAAAVVLFEMATGQTPVYGDSSAHPATVDDEVSVEPDLFDPTVAEGFCEFFRTALARAAGQRHSSAREMRQRWRRALTPGTATTVADGDDLAAEADRDTPLTRAGLTPRALSSLEPLGVATVGELLAVDSVRLQRLPGTAKSTRTEVVDRVRAWRTRLGGAARTTPTVKPELLPGISEIGHTLVRASGRASKSRSAVLHTLLGENPDVDPFATQAVIGASLGITAARAGQIILALQESWGAAADARELLLRMEELLLGRVRELGGAATVDELVDTLLAAMPEEPGAATHGRRLVLGLLRVLSDRQRLRAEVEPDEVLVWRRRHDEMALVAENTALLDLAQALGSRADQLVATINQETGVVPAERAYAELRTVAQRAEGLPTALLARGRLPVLAAGASGRALASAQGELHTESLAPARALALALGSVAPSQQLRPAELIDRVAARFPALARIPAKDLEQLVADSGLDLVWDEARRWFASRLLTEQTAGVPSRPPTAIPTEDAPISQAGVVGQRLLDSRRSHSFLVLGVPADQLDRLVAVATGPTFRARELNVTDLLLRQVREINDASRRPVPWPEIFRADAAVADSRAGRGLRALMHRALDQVVADIAAALAAPQPWESPVLLTDAAPFARYGRVSDLHRWNDLARRREQAVWLVSPQLASQQGALLDGEPVQASPNQFVRVDRAWIGTQWQQLNPDGASA